MRNAGFKKAPRSRGAAAPGAPEGDDKGLVRLSKRMSELGLASRREADALIEKGWVLVDGKPAVLGQKVGPDARIELTDRADRSQKRRVTVLLNKPVGYVSGQAEDGYKPAKTLVTPQNRWSGDDSGVKWSPEHLSSLVPAGRLDIDSVGLLVLTQDGRIAKTIIGETSEVEKEYIVRVAEEKTGARPVFSADRELRFVLKEGKKRQIRRMCAAVGFKVLRLKRVRVGGVRLGALPPGRWRYLKESERF